MAEKTEPKSGIQQQVEAGVEQANKSLLQSIKALLGLDKPETKPETAAPATPPAKSAEILKLEADLDKATKALTELTTKTTELVKQHEAALVKKEEEASTTANHKARQTLAKVGHDAVSAEAADSKGEIAKSKNDLWAEYNKLPSATEKRAFYLKHKEALNC